MAQILFWGFRNGGRVNNYSQNSNSILAMDIGSNTSSLLTVDGTVALDGNLFITTNGSLNAGWYTLIENLGSDPINGFFSDIFFNGDLVTLAPIDGTNGGGAFAVGSWIFAISYAGQSDTGSLFGGNDLILRAHLIPEPASLAILGLGALAMMVRRRK
ncbi:MAG: PEP-CTERM sorting domain-containing protein [Phycisphaerales bacterium]|nr:PEP-CTERM sorting domain-containing protein [Phycisphaerales bacterium]